MKQAESRFARWKREKGRKKGAQPQRFATRDIRGVA
jgi:hypothetical protein